MLLICTILQQNTLYKSNVLPKMVGNIQKMISNEKNKKAKRHRYILILHKETESTTTYNVLSRFRAKIVINYQSMLQLFVAIFQFPNFDLKLTSPLLILFCTQQMTLKIMLSSLQVQNQTQFIPTIVNRSLDSFTSKLHSRFYVNNSKKFFLRFWG